MIVLGIDPGKDGGVAALHLETASCASVVRMPKYPGKKGKLDEASLWELLRIWPPGTYAYLEKVASRPTDGVRQAFSFGLNYGVLRGMLCAAGIRRVDVDPYVWQRRMGLPSERRAGGHTAKKNAHKAVASLIFPDLKVTHYVADALLIAEYGRRLLDS